MLRFALRRLALAPLLALGAATLIFVLVETAPGRPVDALLGDRPLPPEVRERIERAYGFDGSAPERYASWIGAVFLRGELGWSHSRGRPVARALGEALGPTLLLALAALAVHAAAALAFGLCSALRPGGWLDRLLGTGTLALYGMPTFWLALMAMLLFAYGLGWLPASSMESVFAHELDPWERWLDRLRHLVLPAGVLGMGSAAASARFVREGLLTALDEPWVRAARARGVRGLSVVVRHALRTALLPLINLAGLTLPALLSGSLVIEVVFAWPGMGRLTYDALLAQDLAVVLAATLVATLLVVAGSLAADLAMALADPRVRLGRPPAGA